MSKRANYDQVADRYDNQRYRSKEPDPDLAAFLTERGDQDANALRILDLGCGTGSQLVANRSLISAGQMVGLDRSAGMLAQARTKAPEIRWAQGDATRLPFKEASFDYISKKNGPFGLQTSVRPGSGCYTEISLKPKLLENWPVMPKCSYRASNRDYKPGFPLKTSGMTSESFVLIPFSV